MTTSHPLIKAFERADLEDIEINRRAFRRGWDARAQMIIEQRSVGNRGGGFRIGSLLLIVYSSVALLIPATLLYEGTPIRPAGYIMALFAVPGLVFGIYLWRRGAKIDGQAWKDFRARWHEG